MTQLLNPLAIFLIGLVIFFLPWGKKVEYVGLVLMLAGAIGVCMSSGHSLSLK